MVAAGFLVAASRHSAGGRAARRGLGIAVLGNGRLLAAEDAEGTIVDLFWPRPGQWPQIATGSRPPRRSPDPAGGFYAGIDVDGRIRWLRDAPRITLLPDGY